jgi:hypothetical protein
MVCLLLGFAPGIRANKKTAVSNQERRSIFEPWRFLLFGSLEPHIAWVFQASHRGSFSNSSVGTLRLLTATGIPDVCGDFSERDSRRNQRVCHRQPSGFSDGAMSGTARRMPGEIGVSVHFLSFLLKPIHGKLIADGI